MRLAAHDRVMAYVRTLGPVRAWVVLNFSADVVVIEAAGAPGEGLGLPLGDPAERGGYQLLLSNYPAEDSDDRGGSGLGMEPETGTHKMILTLRGYEARVYIKN